MAKAKVKFVCRECGAESVRWLGRCPHCGAWNTLEEVVERAAPKAAATNPLAQMRQDRKPQALSEIEAGTEARFLLRMPEVDRPLGGGLVKGSVTLLGGEPGIGKSTLVFQICRAVCELGETVFYASGEESELQIKMRAKRLGIDGNRCFVLSGADLNVVIEEARRLHPAFLVVDSIQTMYMEESASAMGSPAQIRDCTALLVRLAKEEGIAVFIIGHVTKDGNIAGPRILEHMVDTVLYLEGDRSFQFRVLRTVKNRFGSTADSGLFVMEEDGLRGMTDPSGFLLSERRESLAGSIALACMEGHRPIMAELQALSVHSVLPVPRRISVGYDYNRLVVLLAVLQKRARIPFAEEDVYVNVAGGFKIRETAADLAAAFAVVSVRRDVPIPQDLVALGEVGLTGAVLPVSHIGLRLKEALKMNFRQFILPEGNRKDAEAILQKENIKDVSVRYVSQIREALEAVSS